MKLSFRSRIVGPVPFTPKEVTFVLYNPLAGIDPMRRKAMLQGDGVWRASDFIMPIAGQWRLRVEISP